IGTGSRTDASNVRGRSSQFAAENVFDGNPKTYWSTDDGVNTGWIDVDFGREVEFNRVVLQEQIELGQRVKKFAIDILKRGSFETTATGTTIGYKRILRFPTVRTSKLRLIVEDAKASPAITNIELYGAPEN